MFIFINHLFYNIRYLKKKKEFLSQHRGTKFLFQNFLYRIYLLIIRIPIIYPESHLISSHSRNFENDHQIRPLLSILNRTTLICIQISISC